MKNTALYITGLLTNYGMSGVALVNEANTLGIATGLMGLILSALTGYKIYWEGREVRGRVKAQEQN